MHQERKTRRSCVADMPLEGADDHLDAGVYARALADFIRHAETPLTIGIQGGWGSGKTSLFSLIKTELGACGAPARAQAPKVDTPPACEVPGGWGKIRAASHALLKALLEALRPISLPKSAQEGGAPSTASAPPKKVRPVCIAVNAWEQSLLQGGANAALVAMNLLQDIIGQLRAFAAQDSASPLPEDIKSELARRAQYSQEALANLKRILLASVDIGLTVLTQKDMSGVAKKILPDFEAAGRESPGKQIRIIRDKLASMVACLPACSGSLRLVIFIDDLDRVPPAAAVEILDAIKNVFNVPGCVFVLAIDYDVVVKGLESKLGARTGKNTHEFRQYLDKIIQVPFTLPLGSISQYNDVLLERLLNKVPLPGTSDEGLDEDTLKSLAKYARLATGGNPRSIKRIINSLSLLEHVEREKKKIEEEAGQSITNAITETWEEVEEREFYDGDAPGRLSLEDRFLIVALHINFPEICARLVENPLFPQWSRELDAPWELEFENEEKKMAAYAQNPELRVYFDEDWKKVVYCLCAKGDWLRSNALNIIKLLDNLKNSLGLHSHVDNATSYNPHAPSLSPLFSFLDNLCTISGDYDFPRFYTVDSVTYMLRKIHEGLMKKFPELTFGALPINIVAGMVRENDTDKTTNKYPNGRLYNVKMKDGFDEFSISIDEFEFNILYKFVFTVSGIPSTTIEDVLKGILPPYDLEKKEEFSFHIVGKAIYEDIHQVTICFETQNAGEILRSNTADLGIAEVARAYEAASKARQGLMRMREEELPH